MKTILAALTAAAFLSAAALPAAAQAERAATPELVKAMLASWDAPARANAQKLIDAYGMPDAVTDTALVWDTGAVNRKRPKADPNIVAGSVLPMQQVAEGGAD